jgi:hypothetical protein
MPWRSILSRFGLPVAYVATAVQANKARRIIGLPQSSIRGALMKFAV